MLIKKEENYGELVLNKVCGILINTMTREEPLELVQEDGSELENLADEFKLLASLSKSNK